MSTLELEIRVKQLEKDVGVLKEQAASPRWWHKIAGSFADDPAHEEAMELGREYRSTEKNGLNSNGNDNS